MKNNTQSPTSLNGHSANGANANCSNSQGTLRFDRFFKFRRRRAPKATGAASGSADYREQDAIGYHPDGAYSHGKPVTGETQCSIGASGRVPVPAFGMQSADAVLLALHARAAALCGEAIELVKTYGASLFDSRYGAERLKFEERIAAGHREVGPARVCGDALATELAALPTVVRDDRVKFAIPRDVRVFGLVFLFALWAGVLGAEWTNAASKLFDLLDSRQLAYLATALFVSLAVYVEWLMAGAVTAASRPWLLAWRILSPVCAIAYVCLFAWHFGAGAGATEVAAMGNLMDAAPAVAAPPSFAIDRLLYMAQLATGIVCGAALIQQMKHLLVGREAVMANPDRATLTAEVAPFIRQINDGLAPVAKAAGHLAEWNACRTAFIEHGLRAYRAVLAEYQLIENERLVLQRERELIERHRRALNG